MNVLWITNIVFPEALSLLRNGDSLKGSGGWMIGAAEALLRQNADIKLSVASVSREVSVLTRLEGEFITYWLLPYGKGNINVNHDYEPLWQQVRNVVRPDVIHLHGTEFSHGLAYIEACGVEHVCVSIQGLVSAISEYYSAGLTRNEIRRSITLGTLYFGGIMRGYREYRKRGVCELEILRKVKHVIGRTSWDKARTLAINSNLEYHYGGEILRPGFYNGNNWRYEACVPHSIFLSQAVKPFKGLHMVLRAMPIILRHYPDAQIRVAGKNFVDSSTFKHRLLLTDYGKIIRKLIISNGLEGKVKFTGQLDEEGMQKEYLQCNVFVCPSGIENSPNSLGEAQLLGVPVIASYAGGIPDMMKGDDDHLYRFEEVDMLAYKIIELFDMKNGVVTEPMRQEALRRHCPESNAKGLVDIYNIVKGV